MTRGGVFGGVVFCAAANDAKARTNNTAATEQERAIRTPSSFALRQIMPAILAQTIERSAFQLDLGAAKFCGIDDVVVFRGQILDFGECIHQSLFPSDFRL